MSLADLFYVVDRLGIRHNSPVIHHQLSVRRQHTTCSSPSFIHHYRSFITCQQSSVFISLQPSVICHQPSAICHHSSGICHYLSVICHQSWSCSHSGACHLRGVGNLPTSDAFNQRHQSSLQPLATLPGSNGAAAAPLTARRPLSAPTTDRNCPALPDAGRPCPAPTDPPAPTTLTRDGPRPLIKLLVEKHELCAA